MKKILFYASVRDKNLFQTMSFYATDIRILEDCGCDVTVTNRISDFFQSRNYDCAFIYFWTKGLLPALIAKVLGKSVLFTGGLDALDRGFNRSVLDYMIKKWLFRACALLSDANLIVSRSDLLNIEKTGFHLRRLHLVPHSIDVERYAYRGEKKKNMISTVAWMGTKENVTRKGLDRLLRVFSEFTVAHDHFTLVLIGSEGEGSVYLTDLAQKLNIASRVIFTGRIPEDDKIRMLKESKYYVQLSEYEGFGISAIEALAAGNLVFHSGRGGLSDTMPPEGIDVADMDDAKAVAQAIANAEADYDGYADRIAQGVCRMRREYDYSVRKNIVRDVLALLRSERRERSRHVQK